MIQLKIEGMFLNFADVNDVACFLKLKWLIYF